MVSLKIYFLRAFLDRMVEDSAVIRWQHHLLQGRWWFLLALRWTALHDPAATKDGPKANRQVSRSWCSQMNLVSMAKGLQGWGIKPNNDHPWWWYARWRDNGDNDDDDDWSSLEIVVPLLRFSIVCLCWLVVSSAVAVDVEVIIIIIIIWYLATFHKTIWLVVFPLSLSYHVRHCDNCDMTHSVESFVVVFSYRLSFLTTFFVCEKLNRMTTEYIDIQFLRTKYWFFF